jgi:hypothetical protein
VEFVHEPQIPVEQKVVDVADERMEKLIEKAVPEFFARLVSMAVFSVRRRPGKNTRSGSSRSGKRSFQRTI